MAMAVGIDVSGGTAATTPANTYTVKAGGTNFFVIIPEGTHVYCKDGKFDPAKNVITVEYAAGSDLVASAGWVKVNDPTTVTGASGDTELFEKASNINGFQGGRVANNLYISPFRATVFKTAALFLYLNSSVVIRVQKPLFFPL